MILLMFVVGVLYGVTSVCVGHPFDTLKTKMQAQVGFEKTNMFQTLFKTLRTQGVIGLYRYVVISGDIPVHVISGDIVIHVISGDIPVPVISGDIPVPVISGDIPRGGHSHIC
jgi:hypothetical protein